jgi:hypothetical protein
MIPLALRGALGILAGTLLAPVAFVWSLVRGARLVHADGLLCQAELTALDAVVGPRLAGPALARLSGSLQPEGSPERDVLGLALRLRTAAEARPEVGDQDLVLATFESFTTLGQALARTNVRDYLANHYDTVTPWQIDHLGVVRLRAVPAAVRDPARAPTRRGRLEADLAAGVAELTIGTHPDDGATGPLRPVATLRLLALSPLDQRRLNMSLGRQGRGLVAVGFRNGIRRVVYPVSQFARGLRGG